jgi:HSP20 family protein
MAITRRKPRSDLARFENVIDQIFDPFFISDIEGSSVCCPVVDIYENDKEFVLTMELPGIKKDEFKVNIEDNVLTISGEKKQPTDVKSNNLYRSERTYGPFQRSFILPDGITEDKISAEFENGILNIVIPKLEKSRSKEIKIK